MKRLIVFVVALSLSGCASLPLKQQAVVSLQASETALESSHDAERALCSPTANPTTAITHCDGAAAATIGLTDARHQALARLYSKAFAIEDQAQAALKAWRAGDPKPSSLAEYEGIVNDLIALIVQFIPINEPTAVKATVAKAELVKVLR